MTDFLGPAHFFVDAHRDPPRALNAPTVSFDDGRWEWSMSM
jgi:hypothetical protein